jgi:hypothetical protein
MVSEDKAILQTPPESGGQQPEKRREKKDQLRGFASVIKGRFEQALNSNPKFKERFSALDLKFLLVATNLYPAALLHVDHGQIKVSSVPRNECKKWKKTGAQGLLQCTLEQFMAIAMGTLDPVKAWIKRQVKIRGPRKMIELSKMLAILSGRRKKRKNRKKPQKKN